MRHALSNDIELQLIMCIDIGSLHVDACTLQEHEIHVNAYPIDQHTLLNEVREIVAPLVIHFEIATDIDRISLSSTSLENCFRYPTRAWMEYTNTQDQVSQPRLQAPYTL